jgi:hypothetical protein
MATVTMMSVKTVSKVENALLHKHILPCTTRQNKAQKKLRNYREVYKTKETEPIETHETYHGGS